jgi:hypothetical protein
MEQKIANEIGGNEPFLQELIEVKELFEETNEPFCILQAEENYFEICSSCPRLTKRDIEEAIKWYLHKENLIGKVNLRFNWPRPKLIIFQIG